MSGVDRRIVLVRDARPLCVGAKARPMRVGANANADSPVTERANAIALMVPQTFIAESRYRSAVTARRMR